MINFSRVSSSLFHTAFILSYCWFPSSETLARHVSVFIELSCVLLKKKSVYVTQSCKFSDIIDRSLCACVVDFNLNI